MEKPDPFSIDEDDAELTDADFAAMRPAAAVHGDKWVDEQAKRQRGRPKIDNPKAQVTLRLDAEVLERFRLGGPGWQSRINDVLSREVAAVHVVPDGEHWAVQLPKGERLKRFDTRDEALNVAESMAAKVAGLGKPADVILHARLETPL